MDALITVAEATLIVAFVSPILLFVLGLLWMPFGALICSQTARVRSLPDDGYGATGAGYSALMLLPWVYLVVRMLGRRVPRPVIWAGYSYIYACWLALIAGYVTYIFTEMIPYNNYLRARSGGLAAGSEGDVALWYIATAVNIFTLALSVRVLRRAHTKARIKLGDEPRELLPGGVYVYPFAWPIGWGAMFMILWVVTFGTG